MHSFNQLQKLLCVCRAQERDLRCPGGYGDVCGARGRALSRVSAPLPSASEVRVPRDEGGWKTDVFIGRQLSCDIYLAKSWVIKSNKPFQNDYMAITWKTNMPTLPQYSEIMLQ